MFRPLVFALALALGSVAAFATCPAGQSEMSVESVNGIFCVTKSPICIADIRTGACPDIQPGLPFGSYCGVVATGVYGCKTLDAKSIQTSTPLGAGPVMGTMDINDDPTPTGPATTPAPVSPPVPTATDGSQCRFDQYEMSVEGVPGVFCLSQGPICMAELGTGTCPGPQFGLPNGAYCGVVSSGVYGCKPSVGGASPVVATPAPSLGTSATTPATTTVATSTPSSPSSSAPVTSPVPASPPVPTAIDGSQCANGEYEMSVEGIAGIFCISKGPICMADVSTGTCPGPQFGLKDGSYCGVVASGVYGCKVGIMTTAIPTTTPTTGPTTTTTTPVPASTTTTTTPVPVPTTTTTAPSPVASMTSSCPNGGSPMSVEGIVPIYCVPEPACVAYRATGNCPGSQGGLPWGAYCDIITRTGQYGCKPFNGTNIRNSVVYPAVRNCAGSSKGNAPVSVMSKGTYCAVHPVCAGSQFGNCPAMQDDLASDSKCGYVTPGVYGCMPSV